MTRALLFLILLTSTLAAEENDLPDGYRACTWEELASELEPEHAFHTECKIGSHVDDAPKEGELAGSLLDSGPSAVIAGCVSAITGSFFEEEVDFILPGVEPLVLERSYSSGEKKWHYRHRPKLKVAPSEGKKHVQASYQDDTGFGLGFKAAIPKHSGDVVVPATKEAQKKGLTNCSGGEISGRSNWKNAKLKLVEGMNGKAYLLQTGGNVRRAFERYERKYHSAIHGVSFGKYRLSAEYRPDGNKIRYQYDHGDLVKITAWGAKTKLNELRFTYNKSLWTCQAEGHKASYLLDSDKRIVSVGSSEAPHVSYEYDDSGRLTCKRLPEGRYLKIAYGREGEQKHKAASLYAPVGTSNEPIKTHSILYREGVTYAFDALGQRTVYTYNPDTNHLLSVESADGRLETYSFCHPELQHGGNLFSRKLYYLGEEIFSRTYRYDSFGNVVNETLKGNLTGEGIAEYVKTLSASQDGKNLPLYEEDARKWVRSAYVANKSLLASRFTGSQERILKREFFSYDENGSLIEEIEDDGSSEEKDNLASVTERKLKKIHPTTTFPIGLPETVEELYYDCTSKTYALLHKTRYSYSPQGKIIREEHFGSDGLFAYAIEQSFDPFGNLIYEKDPLGNETRYTYDALGNKLTEENSLQQKRYTYDYSNRLIKEEELDETGNWLTTSHSYDLLGRRVQTIDPDGNEAHFAYDCHNRLVKKTLLIPEECTEEYAYDPMGNIALYTDPNGFQTKSTYTLRGRPVRIEHPDGSIEEKRYSEDGLLVWEKAKSGLETSYTYDAFGNVIRKESLGKVKEFLYSPFHLLWEKDEEGIETHYRYDGAGRLIEKTRAGKSTLYTYDALGREKSVQEGEQITYKEYELKGRVIEERVDTLLVKKFAYDALGNKTEIQTGAFVQKKRYSPQGKILEESDGLGNTTYYIYAHAPYSVTKIDPRGNSEKTTCNGNEQPLKVEHFDPYGALVKEETHLYDKAGHLLSTEAKALPTTRIYKVEWRYDALGRVVETREEEKTTTTSYTASGEKDKITLPSGTTLFHTYDAYNRLVRLNSSDNSVDYRYRYDILDRLLEEEDALTGRTTFHTYDVHGRLLSETLANGLTCSYTYDALDRITSLTLPDSSTVVYRYNSAFLTSVEREGQHSYQHSYTSYNQAGQPLSQTLADGTELNFTYDSAGRLLSSSSLLFTETLSYDASSNPIERGYTDPLGQTLCSYQYDALDQLLEETGKTPHTYRYDALHNRLEKDQNAYAVNSCNRIEKANGILYSYDLNGNLVEKNTEGQITRYRYDALSRLIEIREQELTLSYIYDSSHRRIEKRTPETSTLYLYQNDEEIGSLENGTLIDFKVLGLHNRAVALELNQSLYIPLSDSTGSIVHLLNLQSDLVETHYLSAFGELEGSALTPWLHSGKRLDRETGLYYFGKRYLDPSLGRFITCDPLGYEDGLNLYAYVHNRPLTHHDPDGQYAFLISIAMSLAVSFSAEWTVSATACALEQAGCISTAAFLMGALDGYNLSLVESSPISAVDPGAYSAGKALGLGCSFFGSGKSLVNGAKVAVMHQGANAATKVVSKQAPKWSAVLTKQTAVDAAKKTERTARACLLRDTKREAPIAYRKIQDKISDVIHVTPQGVALPSESKYKIPSHYIENEFRPGSYGIVIDGKYQEKLRIDPATRPGYKGPNYSHYHLNGKQRHLSPRPEDSNPGFY